MQVDLYQEWCILHCLFVLFLFVLFCFLIEIIKSLNDFFVKHSRLWCTKNHCKSYNIAWK
jgi:hypothetical protein